VLEFRPAKLTEGLVTMAGFKVLVTPYAAVAMPVAGHRYWWWAPEVVAVAPEAESISKSMFAIPAGLFPGMSSTVFVPTTRSASDFHINSRNPRSSSGEDLASAIGRLIVKL
jgi:hypothetical protein